MHEWKEMILFFRKQGGVSGKGCRWWQLLEMMMMIVEDEDMEVSLPAMDLHTNTFCHHFPSKKHTQYAKLRCMNNTSEPDKLARHARTAIQKQLKLF